MLDFSDHSHKAPTTHQAKSWRLAVRLILAVVGLISAAPGSESVSEEAKKHLAQMAPTLFAKLRQGQHAHVVFVGDSHLLTCGGAPDRSFPVLFLEDLAESFFLTGGVAEVHDPGRLDRDDAQLTYEILGRPDASCLQLRQFLSTVAFVNSPDAVVLALGAADNAEGVPLETYRRVVTQAVTFIRATKADPMIIGPPTFAPDPTTKSPRFLTNGHHAAWLSHWTRENRVAWVDSHSALLPRSLLFAADAAPEAAWKEWESLLDHDRATGGFLPNQHGRLAKALHEALLGAAPAPRHEVSASAINGPAGLSAEIRLRNRSDEESRGFVFPLGGAGFPVAVAGRGEISLALGPSPEGCDHGRATGLIFVVDQRRAASFPLTALVSPWIGEWMMTAQPNAENTFAAAARVTAAANAPRSLPYRWRWRGEEKAGTLDLSPGQSGEIRASFPLVPGAAPLEIALGPNGEQRLSRTVQAFGHLGLSKPAPLIRDEGEGPAPTLQAEATADSLLLNLDLRGLTLDPGHSPAMILDLSVDARPPAYVGMLGHVGVLRIAAGPEPGAGQVSPMDLAQFGDGYDRVPKTVGVQTRLGQSLDGGARFTVRFTRRFFGQHPWTLGETTSRIGLGCVLTLRLKDSPAPVTFRLRPTPIHPRDAESLAILELTEHPSSQASVLAW